MWHQKLEDMGLILPPSPKPLANYIPAKIVGEQVWVSGQLPLLDGKLIMQEHVTDGNLEFAVQAAKQCFLNALAAALTVVEEEDIKGVDKLSAFVYSETGFFDQAKVANGASDLAVQLFGERGKHVRAAVGVSALPLGAAVEIEAVFNLREE